MASYKAVPGVMAAVENFFKERFPEELSGGNINARVQLLGSADFAKTDLGNLLGLYLHRIDIDPHGRNRHLQNPPGSGHPPSPELPLNLHFLLFARAANPSAEISLMAWGMRQLASSPLFDAARLGELDPSWRPQESVQVMPEEMASEDLLRVWDALPAKYILSVPYVARTVRVEMESAESLGGPVIQRRFETTREVE